MSKTATWMPLYIGDYLADTMHLEAREHGAYLLLLMHYWRNGPLPDDDRALAGIARVDRKTWTADTGLIVRGFFTAADGKLRQKRLDAERFDADENSAKKRAAADLRWKEQRRKQAAKGDTGGGENGGSVDADGHANDDAYASANASRLDVQTPCPYAGVPPSPSPEEKKEDRSLRSLVRSRAAKADPEFAAFYAAYPRHEASDDGLKAWRSVISHGVGVAEIMAGLARFRFNTDPTYIPLPASWLRAGRWKDEPMQARPTQLPQRRETHSEERRRKLGIQSRFDVMDDLDSPVTLDGEASHVRLN